MRTQTHKDPRFGRPLPEELRAHLVALVGKLGEKGCCTQLQLSRTTLSRAMAGLGLRRGTITLIREALRK